MNYYLGIDGGGTKTRAVLIDDNFKTVMDNTYESTHIITCGDTKFVEIFTNILSDANKFANNNIKHIFVALAGYGEFVQDNQRIESYLKTTFNDIPFKVLNDSVGVWAGGLLCEDGIAVIAGTGSCCAAIQGDKYERVGGWGYIAGDEASAYWIAVKTINAYMKMYDGRIKKTKLFDQINNDYNLNEENNMLYLIHRTMDSNRNKIAQIAKSCSEAASNNCPVANSILEQAAIELKDQINTISYKFDFNSPIPISYTGGVFTSTVFVNHLKAHLSKCENKFILKEPITNSAIGSAIYAYILAGNTFNNEKRAQFIKTL